MGEESRRWSVPTPFLPLLWWPAISFILVAADPLTSPATIAAIGVLLVALGASKAAVTALVRQRRQPETPTPS